jgi:uncharacterized protein
MKRSEAMAKCVVETGLDGVTGRYRHQREALPDCDLLAASSVIGVLEVVMAAPPMHEETPRISGGRRLGEHQCIRWLCAKRRAVNGLHPRGGRMAWPGRSARIHGGTRRETSMTTLNAVRQHRSEILELARKHGAANVRVLGSALRGNDEPDSDIDLLVDAPGPTSAWFPAGLILDQEALLSRKIDVVTERGLSAVIRDQVLDEAQPV